MNISDIVPYVPMIALGVAFIGLLVSLRSALTRKDLRSANLRFSLGGDAPPSAKKDIPWKLRRRPSSILFVCLARKQDSRFLLPLMINVENKSQKSIKDIVVEITCPDRFVVT